ncbi:uncharacterized protein [Rutidosis leptorrhynchoides]|uniref:uncharacterized protein n=1 Tax=Rutidosis leptorrhynchoides TaxID=125765 RepID=UPI003A99F437
MSQTTSIVLLPGCTVLGSNKPKLNVSAKASRRSRSSVGFGAAVKKDPVWQCMEGCGACCKLEKGPAFATPEEIFTDPADVDLYRSLVGTDGWCIHYVKSSRKCSIYSDRPYFCRVEPDVFKSLYGTEKKKFNKEACSSCVDTIKAIYGPQSKELSKFNTTIRRSNPN